MESILKDAVQKALTELFGLVDVAFSVEQPNDISHGDYATNAPLVVAKQLAKSPKEIAEALVEKLQMIENVSAVTVAGAGFINFTLTPDFFAAQLTEILKNKDWGKSDMYAGKKILVEHSSPNLFKPFHIGHLMNNAIGESIARLATCSGANVTAITFPSDISIGIAKAIFILLEKEKNEKERKDFSVSDLGDAYVEGTKRFEEDEAIQSRVKEIADNLYTKTPSPELELFTEAKKVNIEYFETITGKLGSHFDAYIYESEAGIDGKKIVQENTPRVFTESDGAIVYVPDESRKDINTAVFINSQGNPTYEAKDIGLIDMKFNQFSPNISMYITDIQQVPHFNVVFAAAEKIDAVWKERIASTIHTPHGRMTLKGKKMSSRLGGVPIVEDLLATVLEEVSVKNADVSNADAEKIAIAALKFSILRAQAGKNIDFDPETSLSFEGDSGPYLQYSVVRAQSVLIKAENVNGSMSAIAANLPTGWQTTTLEKTLIHFPEIVMRSITGWAPHHTVSYLIELAQAFNSWYGNTKIIDASDPSSPYKVALTKAFASVMTSGLKLLAINVPERM